MSRYVGKMFWLSKNAFSSKELEIILNGLEWYLSEWYSGCENDIEEIEKLYKKIKDVLCIK